MKNRPDKVWQSSTLVQQYLQSSRGAIPLAGEQLEVLMHLIAARSEPIQNFLDLGCGGGILAGTILAQYPAATGVLLDFSEPMLEAAREKLSRVSPTLDFVIADYAHPAWIEFVNHVAPFDVIVSGYSIHHQPDTRKQTLFGEIYDLLKPGGLFLNIEHVASPTPWVEWLWEEYYIDALHARQSEQPSPKTRQTVAGEYQQRPDREANILAPVERQCEWLRQIGFEDVDCYFKIFELAVFGGRRT